ncbi:MAG: N-6 DNA methylase [Rhodospirillaceae bacterium]|nr:N-6 DNA methylase [Rhodospirillaceae bacterium]
MRNLFCDHGDLRNEADVEQNFARRLIEALGYSDKAIRPKAALEELVIGEVGAAEWHRPDFAMKVGGHIRWILEAKAPKERLERHFRQPRDYAAAINDAYTTVDPVRFFLLTNGLETHLYEVGKEQPTLALGFQQFAEGNPDYIRLTKALRPAAFGKPTSTTKETIRLSKPTIAEVTSVFSRCHQHIHQSDKISQAKGFEEFVKLITLKLLSDKAVRDAYPGLAAERWFEHPVDEVEFSLRWIAAQERHTANPVDSILFQRFMNQVETEIALQVRKRFFDKGDHINLKPETIRGVVKRLEGLYLFGIDADLNGRLFEDFLSATMRGKDLGQYFTPRTVVKLGVGLGDLKADDMVLDGCCGTGGFLIDSLADMWAKVNRNDSLSASAKQNRKAAIADEQIYGIDFAKSPNLAKIARLNMYLHGDGGSRIFNIDGLDLNAAEDATDSPEEKVEKAQFRNLGLAGQFDVVLTNPPFSKKYERANEGDARILEQYVTASGKAGVFAKLMFFEMYHHYLKPGGRLISVIDDGFLSGGDYRQFREHLRRLYSVKAVISLPGDAFQRSEARVKTSFIVLEKRGATESASADDDPAIFMYPCRYVGNDDPKRRRWMPGDDELRQQAIAEVGAAVGEYRRFLGGNGDDSYIVPASRAVDRLDVKHCLIDRDWRSAGNLAPLSDFVTPKTFEGDDLIDCPLHEEPVQLFTVKYDGTAAPERVILPRTDTEYAELYRVRTGELVISNIAATYGSVAVVPPELDGLVVSKEYTVLEANPGYDARVIWAILRSDEIRAEFLLRTTGANRTRIRWSDIREIAFPYPDAATEAAFIRHMEEAEAARTKAQKESVAAIAGLTDALSLQEEAAGLILDAFKPPR